MMDPLTFQPELHPAIAIGLETVLLLCLEFLCQQGILFGLPRVLHIVIVTASGHAEESAHDRYGVCCPVLADHMVFERWSHFLSVSERKSHNSLFSISRR